MLHICKIFIISSLVGSYQNPCAVENGGCLGLCLLKSKSHSCSCPDGLHLVKTGIVSKCEGKVYNVFFEEDDLFFFFYVVVHKYYDMYYFSTYLRPFCVRIR